MCRRSSILSRSILPLSYTPSLSLTQHPRMLQHPADKVWYGVAEQPAPAPHLARPEGRAAVTHCADYRGTLLIRNRPHLGPYNSICLGPYGGPRGGSVFLEVRYPCTVPPVRFIARFASAVYFRCEPNRRHPLTHFTAAGFVFDHTVPAHGSRSILNLPPCQFIRHR